MNTKRICKHCGGDIPPHKQVGTKFCKGSCKARYHEKKLMKELFNGETPKINPSLPEKKEVIKNLLPGLEGVVQKKVLPETLPSTAPPETKNNSENAVLYSEKDVQYAPSEAKLQLQPPPELIPVQEKVETHEYKKTKTELDKVYAEEKRIKDAINACDTQIETIKRNNFSFFPLTTTAAGGIIAYNKTNKHIGGAIGGAMAGWGIGTLIDNLFFEKDRKKNAEQSIAKIEERKKEWRKLLADVLDIKKKGENYIAGIPRYETKTVMRPNPISKWKSLLFPKESTTAKLQPEILEGLQKATETESKENIPAPETNSENPTNEEKIPDIETNERIMSSKDFRDMTYPALTFQNKWNDFFGEPSTTFHCVVHGKPGEGKSTFCIQFAAYLAKHHGNTIYISGEEGFSKTLQQKVIMTKAEHPRLFITDLKSFDEIKSIIKNEFHFIFIDSLDTLGIDAAKLRELKKLYPSSAFITISQSTKAGGMRGSLQIIHDADIEVYVRNRSAVTNKNRFKQKGTELKIFDTGKPTNKIEMQGNIL